MYSDFKLRKEHNKENDDEIADVHGSKKDKINAINVHVQSRGYFCAKIFFSSLVAFLIGFIMDNFGFLEPDIQKSCCTEYSGGWNDSLTKEYFINQRILIKLDSFPRILKYHIVDNDTEEKIIESSLNTNDENANENTSIITIKVSSVCARSLNEIDCIEAELKPADEELSNHNFITSLELYDNLTLKYPDSAAVFYDKINALSDIATITGSIEIFKSLRTVCLQYLALDKLITDEDFKTISFFCINQMKTIDELELTIDLYLQLIKRFNDDLNIRNDLAATYINLNRFSDVKDIVEENLKRWPNNGVSLVYYGYVFHFHNLLEDAAHYLWLGLETDELAIQCHYLYCLLGEILTLLNRTNEARQLFVRGVAKNLFPNEYQRPGQYIKDLKAQPIWTKEETPYIDIFDLLESNWKQIRDEGISVINEKDYFIDSPSCKTDREQLTDSGLWQEFYIFDDGNMHVENCKTVPFTCALIQTFLGEHICHRCQVIFSIIHPGTHIKPHCGPNNVRLRAQLGLKIPNGARIQVADVERYWEDGKILIFDDSFEHEVWNNGNDIRLVLVIDFWHPHITDNQKAFVKQYFT